ncbi:MAG TPA: hypothetical protein VM537_21225 [Anaerolineae bacterium]|nr:hypothetical protein [Anaerolineae bacterium]
MPTLTLFDPRGLVIVLVVVALVVVGGMAMGNAGSHVGEPLRMVDNAPLLEPAPPFPFTDPVEIALHLETVTAMYEATAVGEALHFPLPTGDVEVKLSRHAREKHGQTALLIYDLIRNGQYRLYYSPKLGQFLALVKYHGMCGGHIFFVDVTGSVRVGYERTAFGFEECPDSCAYWQREIIYGCYKLVGGVGLAA